MLAPGSVWIQPTVLPPMLDAACTEPVWYVCHMQDVPWTDLMYHVPHRAGAGAYYKGPVHVTSELDQLSTMDL